MKRKGKMDYVWPLIRWKPIYYNFHLTQIRQLIKKEKKKTNHTSQKIIMRIIIIFIIIFHSYSPPHQYTYDHFEMKLSVGLFNSSSIV